MVDKDILELYDYLGKNFNDIVEDSEYEILMSLHINSLSLGIFVGYPEAVDLIFIEKSELLGFKYRTFKRSKPSQDRHVVSNKRLLKCCIIWIMEIIDNVEKKNFKRDDTV